MARAVLGRRAIGAIHAAVANLFQRARARFLGRQWGPRTVEVHTRPVEHREDLSLGGVFDASSATERMRPNEALRDQLGRVVASYLDAYEARAKALTVHAVQAHLHEAEASKTPVDLRTVLGGHLADVVKTTTDDVKRLIATETTRAANVGVMDAAQKVSALLNQDEPRVFFVPVRDQYLCDECRTIHLLPDGITPRVYKMSEVAAGYHKRGDPRPCVGGLHPHCRCTMCTLAVGFGFNAAGMVSYITLGHDEWSAQRR